jgi:hypothetical protein
VPADCAVQAPVSGETNAKGASHRWSHLFSQVACATARFAGQPAAFLTAAGLVLLWALTGPLFHYSDTWQLVINTSTTIVTFLMVFLIQHTQNRDTLSLQLKLSELIISMHGAESPRSRRRPLRGRPRASARGLSPPRRANPGSSPGAPHASQARALTAAAH